MTISISLADHRPLLREGLRVLSAGHGVDVIWEAGTRSEAVKKCRGSQAQVIVLGDLADGDPMRTLRLLKHRAGKTPILMLLTDANPTYLIRSYALGAAGCFSLDADVQEFFASIKAISASGASWKSDEIAHYLAVPSQVVDNHVRLTPRERQVARLLTYGLPNKEIAVLLEISIETVKEHVASIRMKLSVDDRTQAAVWAIRNGLA